MPTTQNFVPRETALDSLVDENSLRVSIIDRDSAAEYRVRLEGENESCIELTNTGASSTYLRTLAHNMDSMLNSGQWAKAISEDSHFRVHRAGDEPTPILVPTLSASSKVVKMKDPYTNNVIPAKLTVRQGETIRSKPVEEALMINMSIERFDSEVDGVITEHTMRAEMASIAEQLDNHVTTSIIDALVNHQGAANFVANQKIPLTADMGWNARIEAIEDAIDAALVKGKQFGNDISDFILGFNAQTMRDLQRASRRAGAASVADWLGCDVYTFNIMDPDNALYHEAPQMVVAPRRYCAVSFREQADGTVFDFIVSRQAEKQSTTMEIMGTADLLVAGFTKARTEDGQDVDVALPLVQVFTIGDPALPAP